MKHTTHPPLLLTYAICLAFFGAPVGPLAPTSAAPVSQGLASPAAAQKSGYAVFYGPGVMERVARNRMNPRHRGYVRGFRMRHDVDGWAASTECGLIGRVVTARINGRGWERYQLVDCSHPRDRARHLRQGLVIEVDWNSAVRNRFSRDGRAPATVRLP